MKRRQCFKAQQRLTVTQTGAFRCNRLPESLALRRFIGEFEDVFPNNVKWRQPLVLKLKVSHSNATYWATHKVSLVSCKNADLIKFE